MKSNFNTHLPTNVLLKLRWVVHKSLKCQSVEHKWPFIGHLRVLAHIIAFNHEQLSLHSVYRVMLVIDYGFLDICSTTTCED